MIEQKSKKIRLTELSNCAGCAAKLKPDLLKSLLAGIDSVKSPNALVGFETSDDAAVYRITKDVAVVETVDFFPPVVDDPYAYGQIAAANAMSDIWAMGAQAKFALNVVAFPKDLNINILKTILRGGASKAKEAGIPILGGHSIQSVEPKYGMAVTGTVNPKFILRNAGARAGDVAILTKPIGTGIATTAIKRGLASRELVKQVTAQMAELNLKAGQVFASRKFRVNALTDVTGFGLLGHALEMAVGSNLRFYVELENVPLMSGIADLAQEGVIPGGTKTNLIHAQKKTVFPKGLPEAIKHVLADAQTNGGLLAAVPAADAKRALSLLEKAGVSGYLIGAFEPGTSGLTII
jgi:selenide, water dikinase